MTPTESDIEAVVEADEKGTSYTQSKLLMGCRQFTPSNPVLFSRFALYWVAVIPYADVEVEPMKKAERGDWNQVPVYVDVDGNAMDESNDILHYIDSKVEIYSHVQDMILNKIVGWSSVTRYSVNPLLL